MIKRFLEWIDLKQRLDSKLHKPPNVSEGDIWWASVGENIGSEINGKSSLFSRPVVIYKKLSPSFYLVIPTTSQWREGSWFVQVNLKNTPMNACLHQMKTIDYRRLSSRIGRLNSGDFKKLKTGFKSLYL